MTDDCGSCDAMEPSSRRAATGQVTVVSDATRSRQMRAISESAQRLRQRPCRNASDLRRRTSSRRSSFSVPESRELRCRPTGVEKIYDSTATLTTSQAGRANVQGKPQATSVRTEAKRQGVRVLRQATIRLGITSRREALFRPLQGQAQPPKAARSPPVRRVPLVPRPAVHGFRYSRNVVACFVVLDP